MLAQETIKKAFIVMQHTHVGNFFHVKTKRAGYIYGWQSVPFLFVTAVFAVFLVADTRTIFFLVIMAVAKCSTRDHHL